MRLEGLSGVVIRNVCDGVWCVRGYRGQLLTDCATIDGSDQMCFVGNVAKQCAAGTSKQLTRFLDFLSRAKVIFPHRIHPYLNNRHPTPSLYIYPVYRGSKAGNDTICITHLDLYSFKCS